MWPRQRLAVAAVAAIALAGCGADDVRPANTAPGEASSTTTGIVPPGVPTEGTRPPVAGLTPAAEPQSAPPPHEPLPGRTVAVGESPEGVVVDDVTRTVVVALRSPSRLVLLNADTGVITAQVPLPAAARHVELAAPGGPVLVPMEAANALVRVGLPQGTPGTPIVTGSSPHDATAASNGAVFVSNEHGGTVTVLRGDRILKVFTDSVQPAGVAAVGTAIGMLDAQRNTLTVYDAERLSILGWTSAGAGPTHLVADRHGRMIAADTRGNAIRIFTPLPAPREVATISQPGGPYGIAYDPVRDRLWVAPSGTNEVIGYDMGRPIPRELQRLPTAQNPYSLGVDARSGRLFVAGVTAGVVQIIDTLP